MDAQLRAQLNQQIRISTGGAVDAYGQRSVSTSTLHYARVEEDSRAYDINDKDSVRTTHMIVLDNDVTTPTYAAFIWLPGDSASTLPSAARKPKVIRACPDENGALDHWEVLV